MLCWMVFVFSAIIRLANAANLQLIQQNNPLRSETPTRVDFKVNFFGQFYDRFWIHWRLGYIAFEEARSYNLSIVNDFPNENYKPNAVTTEQMDLPIIAAYFSEMSHSSTAWYAVVQSRDDDKSVLQSWCRDLINTNLEPSNYFCNNFVVVTWNANMALTSSSNSFQILISTLKDQTFVIFNFESLTWHAMQKYGSNSRGILEDANSKFFPKVGFNIGEGRGFLPLPFSGKDEVISLANFQATLLPKSSLNVRGVFVYRISDQSERLVGSCQLESANDKYLSVSPPAGNFIGGQELFIRGYCYKPLSTTTKYRIKLNSSPETEIPCSYKNNLTISCALTNPLAQRSYVTFRLIENRRPLNFVGEFSGRMNFEEVTIDSVERLLGPNSGDIITIRWKPSSFNGSATTSLGVLLYGYRENEGHPDFQIINKVDSLTFPGSPIVRVMPGDLTCKTAHVDCSMVDTGVIAITDSVTRRKIWSRPFLLGRPPEKDSEQACQKRYYEAEEDINWHKDIAPCSCLRRQVEADFRFRPVANSETLASCFVSVPNREATGGTQCCYMRDKTELLLQPDLSSDGRFSSQVMRAHFLGSYPFTSPSRVPYFSHLSTDASFKQNCCIDRNSSCSLYQKSRPFLECSRYRSPYMASVYGLGHFKTFRGTFFQFYGKGEYTLLKVGDITIDARFEQVVNVQTKTIVRATGVSAIGIKVSCDAMSRRANNRNYAFVRRGKTGSIAKLHLYIDGIIKDPNLDNLKDGSLQRDVFEAPCFSAVYELLGLSENVTFYLTGGTVVRVLAVSQILNMDVQVSQDNELSGLLALQRGVEEVYATGRQASDFQVTRSKSQSALQYFGRSEPSDFYNANFKADRRSLINESSFQKGPDAGMGIYLRQQSEAEREVHFPNFVEDSETYDRRLTSDNWLAEATKKAESATLSFHKRFVSSRPFCRDLAVPQNAIKSSLDVQLGAVVLISCQPGFMLTAEHAAHTTTCQLDESSGEAVWHPAPANNICQGVFSLTSSTTIFPNLKTVFEPLTKDSSLIETTTHELSVQSREAGKVTEGTPSGRSVPLVIVIVVIAVLGTVAIFAVILRKKIDCAKRNSCSNNAAEIVSLTAGSIEQLPANPGQ